ncbi:MAG: quinone-dependent dihydroorotate dehydrogenase [Candidatus Dojkabacteria bacterium]
MYLFQPFFGLAYKRILKPILFLGDPEKIHDGFLKIGGFLGGNPIGRKFLRDIFFYKHLSLKQNIHGIDFQNPVGLSAGFDKDGKIVPILEQIGFGFTQIGSVTLHPYEGNPGKRLIRLIKSKAILVNYGLKNDGVKEIIQRVKKHKTSIPLSFSIAKTNSKKASTRTEAIKDYIGSIKQVDASGLASFITINISCPNTFGGEPFNDPKSLTSLLKEVDTLKLKLPIFVKMPNDVSWEIFDSLLKVIIKYKLAGVIISNLVKDRSLSKDVIPDDQKGAMGGLPAKEVSNKLISKTYRRYGEKLTIIGVGGIFNAEDAYEKIKLGASLVQLITGMVYEGPQLISTINHGLVRLLSEDGYKDIREAIGSAHR